MDQSNVPTPTPIASHRERIAGGFRLTGNLLMASGGLVLLVVIVLVMISKTLDPSANYDPIGQFERFIVDGTALRLAKVCVGSLGTGLVLFVIGRGLDRRAQWARVGAILILLVPVGVGFAVLPTLLTGDLSGLTLLPFATISVYPVWLLARRWNEAADNTDYL
jgi:hypothetical protein